VTHILIICGTTREGRFSERVVDWVAEQFADLGDVTVELLDLRDHPLPFFEGPSPAREPRVYRSEEIARFGRRVDNADAFVVLTAEYNHGYPAVLKNAMDHTFVEWRRKPIAFVGWGNVGGARAIEQLREVAVEFEMTPTRHAVHILPDVMRPARAQTEPLDTSVFASLQDRLAMLSTDLLWWARALAVARARDTD
jgi:NAD(P)H-dependent FMN reductase